MLVPSSVCTHLLYQRLGTITHWNAVVIDLCPTSSRSVACVAKRGIYKYRTEILNSKIPVDVVVWLLQVHALLIQHEGAHLRAVSTVHVDSKV